MRKSLLTKTALLGMFVLFTACKPGVNNVTPETEVSKKPEVKEPQKLESVVITDRCIRDGKIGDKAFYAFYKDTQTEITIADKVKLNEIICLNEIINEFNISFLPEGYTPTNLVVKDTLHLEDRHYNFIYDYDQNKIIVTGHLEKVDFYEGDEYRRSLDFTRYQSYNDLKVLGTRNNLYLNRDSMMFVNMIDKNTDGFAQGICFRNTETDTEYFYGQSMLNQEKFISDYGITNDEVEDFKNIKGCWIAYCNKYSNKKSTLQTDTANTVIRIGIDGKVYIHSLYFPDEELRNSLMALYQNSYIYELPVTNIGYYTKYGIVYSRQYNGDKTMLTANKIYTGYNYYGSLVTTDNKYIALKYNEVNNSLIPYQDVAKEYNGYGIPSSEFYMDILDLLD